jgi:two-component system, LytTR family, response regulator
MIKAVIIDDEPLARAVVKEYLQDRKDISVVQECNDGLEGVKAIQQHGPDLVFLDIQMPKINGFEMLELVDDPPFIIFTTAFDEYALKAFDSHAIDYLLKPFSRERFDKAIGKLLDQVAVQQQKENTQSMMQSASPLPSHAGRIVVKTGGKIRIIPLPSVLYLEAADDYVKIHTAEGMFLKNKTMSWFENNLPASQFIRTHRSYMVNVQEITRIHPHEKDSHIALLRSGANIPVSKAGYVKLKEVLGL